MVCFKITLVAERDRVASLASVLHRLMIQAQGKRACLRCELSADLADADTLHYVEEWATEDDLRMQIRSERFHRLILAMEEASERPRVAVQLVARSSGLEYIEDALRDDRS